MEKTKQIADRLQQQMDFVLAIDREKAIRRQTWLADDSRRETDAEHAWHLAMMVLVLSEYAEEAIDVTRTMAMVLCHDLVEIDAGDTYAYDEAAKRTQAAREQAAADRIFAMLLSDQGIQLRGLWEEFEAGETPEAKFAHTLDCLQPTLLNHAVAGKSWRRRGVKRSQIMARNARVAEGSQVLWDYSYATMIAPHVADGSIIDDREPTC